MQHPVKKLLLVVGLFSLAACNRTELTPETSPVPNPGSVTILQGDAFEKGMASLTLPDLSSGERVAVIPVYGTQDVNVPDIRFSVGTAGLKTALTPTAKPDKTEALSPKALQEKRRLERFQETSAQAAELRRAGTSNLKEARQLGAQNLDDNCPAPYAVGTTKCDFYFYNFEADEERLIDTTLRFESANAYWFVDDAYADEFTPEQLTRLAQIFEEDIVPVDTQYFGPFPDFDNNGKIFIVFSQLDAYGYVDYNDFFDNDEVLAETGYHSNEGDIFYAYLPSDNEAFGFDYESYFTENLPSTLVHELKHLIAGGIRLSAPEDEFIGLEESWAEEASAVAAEELSPYGSAVTGYAQSAAGDALADPEAYRIVDDDEEAGPEGFSYYGYDFLFLWRVAERVGHENFWKPWTAGPETGVANIEKNAAELGSFADMMTDWAVTVMFDHTGKVSGYDYEGLNLRDGTWQNPWYSAPLSADSSRTRSLAYYVGYGDDRDAAVTVRSSDPEARVAVVRFTGDLPY